MNRISNPLATEVEYGLNEDVRNKILTALEEQNIESILNLFLPIHPADQADFISSLDSYSRNSLIEAINCKTDFLFLTHLDKNLKNDIVKNIDISILARAINNYDHDLEYILYIIDDLDSDIIEEILKYLSFDKVIEVNKAFSYPDETIGRIMHQNFIAVKEEWTARKAIEYLKTKELPDNLSSLIVVDNNLSPISEVFITKILKSNESELISKIMSKELTRTRTINAYMDQEEGARLLEKYSLNQIPVVNNKNVLVGVIYVNDVLDILEEEAEEDLLFLGRVNASDLLSSPIFAVKSRLPWLFTSLITTSVAVTIIAIFSNKIQELVALAVLMPIVAALAGNAGTQALTILIRSIAKGEVNDSNIVKILFKEILAGSINGIILSSIALIFCLFWSSNLFLSIILAIAIFLNIIISGFFGALIPIILNKMKLDPAISSSVFLIAISDTISFLIFLGLASLFLI